MEEGSKRCFTRRDLADLLEDLARQLKRGSLQVAGASLIVPESLEGKTEFKVHPRGVSLKLRVKWSGPPTELTAAAGQGRGFKDLKQRLGKVLAGLRQALGQGILPAEEQVQEFLDLSRASAALAAADWEKEMQEFLDHAENLLRARRQGSGEMFAHELRDLETRMATCHQEYK